MKYLIYLIIFINGACAQFSDLDQDQKINALMACGREARQDQFEDFFRYIKCESDTFPYAEQETPELEGITAEQITALSDYVLNHLSSKMISTLLLVGKADESQMELSDLQWGDFQLGCGVALLKLNGARDAEAHKSLYEGFDKLMHHYLGETSFWSQKVVVLSFDAEEDAAAPASMEAQASPPFKIENIETFIQEGKNVSQLFYALILGQDLAQKNIRIWDLCKAARFFSMATYGLEEYEKNLSHYLKSVVIDPFEAKMTAFIDHTQDLYQTLDYAAYQTATGNTFESLHRDPKMAFMQCVDQQIDCFSNALLMGVFNMSPKKERSFEEGKNTALTVKKLYYKYLTKTATKLLVAEGQPVTQESILEFINSYFEQEGVSSWMWEETQKLFTVVTDEGGSYQIPNWESGLWGELVFGYERVQEFRDQTRGSPSALEGGATSSE